MKKSNFSNLKAAYLKHCCMWFAMLLPIFVSMSGGATARAEEAASETVIVPYDSTKPLAGQKLDQLYVPYDRFIELWEAAKATRRGIKPEKLAERYLLSNARYEAQLDSRTLRVKGAIDLETFGEDWVNVPLSFKRTKLSSLLLDGKPAPLDSGSLVIEKAGPHHVDVEFEVAVKSGNSVISWNIPETPATLVVLTLPDKQMKATIQPGSGIVERTAGNQKIVTAALGKSSTVEINLDSSVGLANASQAAVAKMDVELNITPAVESVHALFNFSFPEAQQDHFTVYLDKALSLVNLDVPNLKSWKLTVENERQVLEIALTEAAGSSFKFKLDAERSLSEPERKFPLLSAAAGRIERTSAIFAARELEITPHPSEGFRQVSYPLADSERKGFVAAYSSTTGNESLRYSVQPANLQDKAEISYVYQVNHSKIELVASLKLRAEKAPLFDIAIGLPRDFTVEAVESGRLKDWWREGDTLHVRFKGAPPAMTPLVMHLVKLYKTRPEQLEIRSLALPESWKVEGSGIIAASKSVNTTMTLVNAKETNPQNAATDFRILPPMERKRGFTFKETSFGASVKLETLPARVTATWVMSAQAHESWVSVSTHVGLTARQGSFGGVSFKLPASSPEARVTGDNVRETTSSVDGGWRVYHVAFQGDVADAAEFTVDLDLMDDGRVGLPDFVIAGVERAEGFIVVDNATEYEMGVWPGGLDAAVSRQIPFLPQISRNARLYRALPGWSLHIGLTRLEKEAGRSAYVAWAELTTALRRDGTEWYRATYHLQNRSLQFLPVKLQGGAELASVRVAGENVRADRGKVDGKEVLLIPLIKTKPGDVSYDVDVVWRNRGGRSGWLFRRKALSEPEVVGITVERTLWNLYLPEDENASGFGGNVEEVLAEVNKTEKLEGMLDELKKLNGLFVSSSYASRKAGVNFRELSKKLEEENLSDADDGYLPKGGETSKQALATKQHAYVTVKKREIQEELERQQKVFQANEGKARTDLVVDGQPQQGAGGGGRIAQSWSNNSVYAPVFKPRDEAGKDVDQRDSAGKKIYINDYVMNVQEAARPLQEGRVYSGSESVAADATAAQPQMKADGLAPATPAPKEQNQFSINAGTFSSMQGQIGYLSRRVPEAKAKAQKSRNVDRMEEDVKVLNNARSNLTQQPEVAPQHAAAGQSVPIMSEATPSMAMGISGTFTSGGQAFGGAAASVDEPVARAQLQQSGAISLPIDFPTEGRVYHFKKLKANAKLTLWITEPAATARWKWVLGFVVAAAVIEAISRTLSRRKLHAVES